MQEKSTILMICSWLDFDKLIGACFWEQAKFVEEQFNMILCHFRKKELGTNLNQLIKGIHIEQAKSPNGIETLFINYPSSRFLSEKINIKLHRQAVKKLYQYLKQREIDVSLVHAQSIYHAGFEALYFKEFSRVPYIFTEHNQFTFRERSEYETKLTSKVISYAQKKMVVSYDKIRQFASNWYYHDFVVVGNGVDSTTFNYINGDQQSVFDSKKLRLVTTGAFVPMKDQKTIFNALQILDNLNEINIKFTWIGYNCWGKDVTKTLNDIIDTYQFKNITIELHSLLPREQVALKLREADLFVFSSLTEGMPLSVLEALACGLPVCTTRCGGVDELIDVSNGNIVQIKDSYSMAEFIRKFYQGDIGFDKELISKGILDKYGEKAFSEQMVEHYNGVLEK